jgi:hypothetical protein
MRNVDKAYDLVAKGLAASEGTKALNRVTLPKPDPMATTAISTGGEILYPPDRGKC